MHCCMGQTFLLPVVQSSSLKLQTLCLLPFHQAPSKRMNEMSLSTSSDTGGLPPTGVGHPRWLSSAVVWIAQAPPGRRHPDNPNMDRHHCRSKITALPPCLQVPMPPWCAFVEHACMYIVHSNKHTSNQSQANMKVSNQVACWPSQLAPHWQRLHGRVCPQQPCPLSQAD